MERMLFSNVKVKSNTRSFPGPIASSLASQAFACDSVCMLLRRTDDNQHGYRNQVNNQLGCGFEEMGQAEKFLGFLVRTGGFAAIPGRQGRGAKLLS